MLLSSKQENEEVKRQTIELFELEQKFKAIRKQYEEKKARLTTSIKNFMFCNKCEDDEFHFVAMSGDRFSKEHQALRVKKVTPTSIVWDADKLEEKLPKELCSQIVHKEYKVNDMPGLIEYLKSCGVSPKKFKSFLTIEKSVDANKIAQLDAVGEITHTDVKGCYTVSSKSSYLRIGFMEDED